MAEKAKGKKTTKRKTKFRVPNLMVEDSEVEDEAEDEDEGFKAKPKTKSSSMNLTGPYSICSLTRIKPAPPPM